MFAAFSRFFRFLGNCLPKPEPLILSYSKDLDLQNPERRQIKLGRPQFCHSQSNHGIPDDDDKSAATAPTMHPSPSSDSTLSNHSDEALEVVAVPEDTEGADMTDTASPRRATQEEYQTHVQDDEESATTVRITNVTPTRCLILSNVTDALEMEDDHPTAILWQHVSVFPHQLPHSASSVVGIIIALIVISCAVQFIPLLGGALPGSKKVIAHFFTIPLLNAVPVTFFVLGVNSTSPKGDKIPVWEQVLCVAAGVLITSLFFQEFLFNLVGWLPSSVPDGGKRLILIIGLVVVASIISRLVLIIRTPESIREKLRNPNILFGTQCLCLIIMLIMAVLSMTVFGGENSWWKRIALIISRCLFTLFCKFVLIAPVAKQVSQDDWVKHLIANTVMLELGLVVSNQGDWQQAIVIFLAHACSLINALLALVDRFQLAWKGLWSNTNRMEFILARSSRDIHMENMGFDAEAAPNDTLTQTGSHGDEEVESRDEEASTSRGLEVQDEREESPTNNISGTSTESQPSTSSNRSHSPSARQTTQNGIFQQVWTQRQNFLVVYVLTVLTLYAIVNSDLAILTQFNNGANGEDTMLKELLIWLGAILAIWFILSRVYCRLQRGNKDLPSITNVLTIAFRDYFWYFTLCVASLNAIFLLWYTHKLEDFGGKYECFSW